MAFLRRLLSKSVVQNHRLLGGKTFSSPFQDRGGVAIRLRELLRQGCEARGLEIIRGSISKDHVHMLLSSPATMAPSDIMRYLKGRSSHILQDEFPEIKKKYWGQHMWARGYFCGTVGAVDEETIKKYVEDQGKEEEKNFTIVDE